MTQDVTKSKVLMAAINVSALLLHVLTLYPAMRDVDALRALMVAKLANVMSSPQSLVRPSSHVTQDVSRSRATITATPVFVNKVTNL